MQSLKAEALFICIKQKELETKRLLYTQCTTA